MLSECSNSMDWWPGPNSERPTWILPQGGSYNDPIITDLQTGAYTAPAYYFIYSRMWNNRGEQFPTPVPELREPLSPLGEYTLDMATRIIALHPEFLEGDPVGPRYVEGWWWGIDLAIVRNNGRFQDPFRLLDLSRSSSPPEEDYEDFEDRSCVPYFLFYEVVVPAGETSSMIRSGYLFYEVGGLDHFRLDGELREVRFVFPPNL
jgi:hypothetical protein